MAANETSRLFTVPLRSQPARNVRLVGAKAATLAELASEGFPVADGFCVTTVAHSHWLAEGRLIVTDEELSSHISMLQQSARGYSMIVRASAIEELDAEHLFAGLFASVMDVHDLPSVKKAIIECFRSAQSRKVVEYCRANDLNPSKLSLGCLIQEQLPATWSGVAFTNPPIDMNSASSRDDVLIEISEGHLGPMLGGGPVAQAVLVKREDSEYTASLLGHVDSFASQASNQFVFDVAKLALSVRDQQASDQDIEWLFDGDEIYLLQARPHTRNVDGPQATPLVGHSSDGEESLKEIFADEKSLGLKGAAMIFYRDNRMFQKPVVFIYPGADREDAKRKIANLKSEGDGITVRFSHKNIIGLPRFFARTVDQAASAFLGAWRAEWLGIVHEYISVQDSFELYIGSDHYVLEHIPGLWESDNQLVPDVIISDRNELQVLRYMNSRKAKFEEPGAISYKDSDLAQVDAMRRWIGCASEAAAKIRAINETNVPLICHFVEDADGTFNFLNLRRTATARHEYASKGTFHIVRAITDMESWDGASRILLRITVPRGSEASLSELARLLPKASDLVFIDFGLLSHPAIILREFGIDLRPAYLTHEKVKIDEV